MSGFLGVFGPAPLDEAVWATARRRLAPLGTERWQLVRGAGGSLAVGRYAWEDGPEFSGDVLVAGDGRVLVAADASLYYRAELRRELLAAGTPPRSLAPADLILAAYRAWGDAVCERLEGDFSFVVWDRTEGRVLAGRDLSGRRGLYFARQGAWLGVASSVGPLLELPFVSEALNLAAVGAQAAGLLWASGSDTVYRDVAVVPAAHAIRWDGRHLDQPAPFWAPPTAPSPRRRAAPVAEAAVALRGLIEDAVHERLASSVTSVWMSGGWDSPSVFAAGRARVPDATRIRPVSISYPEGDPGREDEQIRAIAARWNADVHWLDSANIPLLDGLVARAGATDEPPAHLYELWNVALARGTRAVGSRVALDGAGGDQLFQVSDIVMADLLRGGHWRRLARYRHARGIGRRRLLELGVLPLMPRWLLRGAAAATGRRVPLHYVERPMARWIQPAFAAAHGLRERDLAVLDAPKASSFAQRETALFLVSPVWGWGAAFMHTALLREGIEARSPLLDRRVVDFALRRPVSERSQNRETKILLRGSMAGLLPDEVLAPRPRRTGLTVGFSRARMREGYPALFDAAFSEPLRLADLGIIDPNQLRAAAADWRERGDDFERVNLFNTLKVEFWLRGLELRSRRARAPTPESVPTLFHAG
jgi:asparagine synthase (glutamine-hydrolysing)